MRIRTVLLATSICMSLAPLSVLASAAAESRFGNDYSQCDGSTTDMVECIIALSDKWDHRLNAAYSRVMGAETAGQKAALRDAQRLWIAYRNANCAYYAGGEGTIARTEAASCLYALTRDRALELEMMSQQ